LFPETYQLPIDGITAPAVVDVMLDRFEAAALPIYQETPQTPGLSLLEWVTLASIVEKESVVPDERNLIAGVFTNRLNIPACPWGPTQRWNMAWAFARPKTSPSPGPRLKPRLRTTLTSTRVCPLPPLPVLGRLAWRPPSHLKTTEYLYFVARYDGTHVFSRTLAEHEAARDEIRANLDN
jgi:UPF0755 protein